jgi:hypothetical protein
MPETKGARLGRGRRLKSSCKSTTREKTTALAVGDIRDIRYVIMAPSDGSSHFTINA